ncbi:hypothetical protein EDP2_3943 [Enterobacter cloacae S611]|uniref:Uncharacterized protein n=1 Tax=Enterobacter cloacae S611 TaxID=1399146 RepID=A0ABN0QB12_ENTCL|nr:hypothetical protein EDP2_3943 [Enterobacter cloacae S611]
MTLTFHYNDVMSIYCRPDTGMAAHKRRAGEHTEKRGTDPVGRIRLQAATRHGYGL